MEHYQAETNTSERSDYLKILYMAHTKNSLSEQLQLIEMYAAKIGFLSLYQRDLAQVSWLLFINNNVWLYFTDFMHCYVDTYCGYYVVAV